MSLLGLDQTTEQTAEQTAKILAVSKRANTILVVSAISILFCCLGGCVATYVAYKAKQDAAAGNVAGAERGINIATGLMIASYVLGILGIIGKLIEAR